ncbi:MAG TPA: PAS domain S-box protein, partial [Bacillota bacterium]|nr:PAS domain S-box protein [Bacillota bacterium]
MLPLALLVLKAAPCPGSLDLPYLRAALSFVFGTLIALGVVVLVGRSFLVRGQPGLLLLSCGLLFSGLSGIIATVVGGQDVNLNVTIFNLCAWLSAGCHLLGVVLLLRRRRPLPAPGLWLWLGSLLVLTAVGLVALAARAGWTPLFFIQGQGGTPVRQLILSSAVILFALAALLPSAARRQPLSPFLYWYSLGLGLNAAGLLGATLQPVFGGPLSWIAWATMCLGGVYMLMAALASVRESRAWGTALEVALHESEERFQALTQASFEGIAIAEAGRMADCNEQFLRMLGYRREELIGLEIATFVPPEEQGRVLANIVQNREACLEHAVLRKDGTRLLVEAHGKPLAYEGRQVRVVAIRDITERKRADQALQAAQAKLQAHAEELEQVVAQRTAKLHEAIGELEHFSYAITHDMRAPLRAMQGYADMLDQRCGECCQPMNQEFFRRIKIAASRMDQLITDSLNYSKAIRQEVALEPVNLHELLEGMIHTYPNLLPDQADIRLEPDLPTVMGNQAALTQCFGNLLGNAVKFAKPNTKPQI